MTSWLVRIRGAEIQKANQLALTHRAGGEELLALNDIDEVEARQAHLPLDSWLATSHAGQAHLPRAKTNETIYERLV